jgi:hypothetical protein
MLAAGTNREDKFGIGADHAIRKTCAGLTNVVTYHHTEYSLYACRSSDLLV